MVDENVGSAAQGSGQTGGFEMETPSFEGKSEQWFDSQIQLGRKDPDFIKGSRLKNDRAELIQNQITKLYENHPRYKKGADVRAATPEPDRGLHDRLTELGLDKETIEREGQQGREAVLDQEAHLEYLQAEGTLRQEWGKDYDDNVGRVHFLLDKIVNADDRQAIIDNFGNSPEMISALSFVMSKLDGVFKLDSGKYRRPKEEKK